MDGCPFPPADARRLVLVGVAVLLGWDQDVQTWVLIHSPVRPWDLDSGFIPS